MSMAAFHEKKLLSRILLPFPTLDRKTIIFHEKRRFKYVFREISCQPSPPGQLSKSGDTISGNAFFEDVIRWRSVRFKPLWYSGFLNCGRAQREIPRHTDLHPKSPQKVPTVWWRDQKMPNWRSWPPSSWAAVRHARAA